MDWNTSSARAERLAGLDQLDQLSRRDIRRVIKSGTSVRLPAGDDLVREGEPGVGVYLLVAGELAVHQGSERIGSVRAGELIGEIGLVERVAATATLTAVTECEALLIEYAEARQLVDELPAFRNALLATAHHRLERDRHRE